MPYPNFWHSKDIYFQVMDPYLRFTIASAGSIIIGSWLNIHFLSKWSMLVHGKYFALRSLGSSFIGELFITIFSMLIANFGNMESSQLIYMMACCFTVKTLVSLIAVWPAALVVCLLKNDETKCNNYQDLTYLQKILINLKSFSKPAFRLDKIDTESKKASIYCRGARIVIEQKITEVILNPKIIQNMESTHSAYIGYYFGLLTDNKNGEVSFLLDKNHKSKFYLIFLKDKYTISSISRDGRINYYKNDRLDDSYTQKPLEIYRNESLLAKFEASHACYIGMLVGLAQNKSKNTDSNPSKLTLISNKPHSNEVRL